MDHAGRDVVQESGDGSANRQIWAGSHRFDICSDCGGLIANEVELNVFGIRTGGGENFRPKSWEIDFGGAAISVMKDRDPVDLKLVY